MIKVIFDNLKDCHHLAITGHDQIKASESLVCAGVTAIITGAWNAFDQLYAQDVTLTAGNGHAVCKINKSNCYLQTIIKVIYYQILTLAQQYRTHIQIYIGGDKHEV